eukprot:jgi/Mesvir1/1454/Mv14440-RA.2
MKLTKASAARLVAEVHPTTSLPSSAAKISPSRNTFWKSASRQKENADSDSSSSSDDSEDEDGSPVASARALANALVPASPKARSPTVALQPAAEEKVEASAPKGTPKVQVHPPSLKGILASASKPEAAPEMKTAERPQPVVRAPAAKEKKTVAESHVADPVIAAEPATCPQDAQETAKAKDRKPAVPKLKSRKKLDSIMKPSSPQKAPPGKGQPAGMESCGNMSDNGASPQSMALSGTAATKIHKRKPDPKPAALAAMVTSASAAEVAKKRRKAMPLPEAKADEHFMEQGSTITLPAINAAQVDNKAPSGGGQGKKASNKPRGRKPKAKDLTDSTGFKAYSAEVRPTVEQEMKKGLPAFVKIESRALNNELKKRFDKLPAAEKEAFAAKSAGPASKGTAQTGKSTAPAPSEEARETSQRPTEDVVSGRAPSSSSRRMCHSRRFGFVPRPSYALRAELLLQSFCRGVQPLPARSSGEQPLVSWTWRTCLKAPRWRCWFSWGAFARSPFLRRQSAPFSPLTCG